MKFLSLFAFVIITAGCSSQKIDNTLSSFEEGYQPYSQSWTGGIPGSGSGVNLFLPLDSSEMEFMDTVYFNGMITNSIEAKDPDGYVIARFQIDFNNKPDRNMNLDTKKEYGNNLPKKEKFPFELEENEAVVKFTRDGKTSYTKITGIQKRSAQDLPSRPQ